MRKPSPEQPLRHRQQVQGRDLDVAEVGAQQVNLTGAQQDVFALLGRLAAQTPAQPPRQVEQPVVPVGFGQNELAAGFEHPHQLLDGMGVLEGVVERGTGTNQIEFRVGEAAEVAGVARNSAHAVGDVVHLSPTQPDLDRHRRKVQ